MDVFDLYNKTSQIPLVGKRIFTTAFQWVVPYFRSIPITTESVERGVARASMRDVKKVRNHLNTVHAIALCNLAEFAMGCVAEATVPKSHRWIPKGMTVSYLAKARGTLRAEAKLALPEPLAEKQEVPVEIEVRDKSGAEVFHATIRIWVTAKSKKAN